jgi:disabled family protein 2
LTPGTKPIDSWANFEAEKEKPKEIKSDHIPPKHEQESGSSDGKLEWKQREKEYRKRWPKQHTSSSSRDVSPWEDGSGGMPPDQKKRTSHMHPPSHYDRYARPPGNARRRRNSCDEDYEDDYEKRPPMPSRMRASKGSIHRSKELLDSESPSWYQGEHWYPDNEDNDGRIMDRHRSHFDRNAYERSTYGPPYMDKREPKSFPYDRRGCDKRSKYYRYNRPDYEYDPYEMPPPRTLKGVPRKDYDDYEPGTFERGARESRSAREYFYDRDRRSFDSNESYDSGRMNRMGSGEIYSHHDYRERYRMRRNQRSRVDDDSDEEIPPRRPSGETGSLQRGQVQRGKMHGNIKLDEDIWGVGGKWKQRPSSATADRKEVK